MELATRDPRCSKPKDSVDLSYNNLTEVPSDVTRFHYLQILRLDNNRLEDVPWQALMQMRSLATVNLAYNLISELPEILARWIAIRTLDLSYNRIKKLTPRLWPLFFQTGTKYDVQEDYKTKDATRRLYTRDGVPLPEVIDWGEYVVGDCGIEIGWCGRRRLQTADGTYASSATKLSAKEMWIIGRLGEKSRTNFEGNPFMEPASMLPYTDWQAMATAWREQYDKDASDIRKKPAVGVGTAAEADEGPNESSDDSEEKECRRKDRREDTRNERRGHRIKSLSHTRARDAKHNT